MNCVVTLHQQPLLVAQLLTNSECAVAHIAAFAHRNKDGNLMPVAIELAHYDAETGKTPSTVYTPKDGANIWLLAKFLFMSIDSSVHQLISHWLRTHACAEPYLISTRRQLSPTHPVSLKNDSLPGLHLLLSRQQRT